MSAAGTNTTGLSAGSLSIPITYDASALEAQAQRIQKQAEDQGARIANAQRRAMQKAQAEENRVTRIQQSVGGEDDFTNMPLDKVGKGADKAAEGADKAIIKMGALVAAGNALNQAMDAVAESLEKVYRGELSFAEGLEDMGKGVAGAIPIIGNFFEAGVKMRSIFDGTMKATIAAEKAQKEHNERVAQANKLNAENARKIEEARRAEEARTKEIERQAEARRNAQFNVISGLEDEYNKLTKSEEDLLRLKLRGLEASEQTINLAVEQLRINKQIRETQEAARKAEDERTRKAQRVAETEQSARENIEDRVARLSGTERQLERRRMIEKGISEEMANQIMLANEWLDKEEKKQEEVKKLQREIESLEERRYMEVNAGAMGVDRARTAFGVNNPNEKIKTEDPVVAQKITDLKRTLEGLVLQ